MILLLLMLLVLHVDAYDYSRKVCVTKQCFQTGFTVDQSIHHQTDPCQNFYKYACGDWISKSQKPFSEMFWNHWTVAAMNINDRIRNILDENDADLFKVNKFFDSCMNADKDYLQDLTLLIDLMGGWPMAADTLQAINYDWLLQIIEIAKLFNVHSMLRIDVGVDFQNTTKYSINLVPPNLVLPRYILASPSEHIRELLSYKKWIVDTIRYMYPKLELNNLDSDVDKMIAFEIRLAKLQLKSKSKRKSFRLDEFTDQTSRDWVEILSVMFSETSVKITHHDYVSVTDYAFNFFSFVNKTEQSVISNYVIWCLVKELSRDTSNTMRKLNFYMDNTILGVKEDIPREDECLNKVTEYLSHLLIAKYIEKYVDERTIKTVARMTSNIKMQFLKILKNNKWLSKYTKQLVLQKIEAVKIFIGYPDWKKNFEEFEELHRKVSISDNHFANILELRRYVMQQNLKKYTSPVKFMWPNNLFEVNAYYNVLQNAIIISVGLLEPPFFAPDRADVFNYASLGSLIGHELSHALDTTGRKADKNGNVRRWWPAKDIKAFEKQIECFKNQYKNFSLSAYQSLGENLADNVGLQLSYLAYKDNRKVNLITPFLETFTDDQLFFISYSQVWCEVIKSEEILQEDEHAPVQLRVLGSLRNNKHFEESFKCKNVGYKKCTLW